MAFWRCFYHMIWTTKDREPIISSEVEAIIIRAIREKSAEIKAPVIAINTVADHIHVAVNIPPKLAVSEWARHAKGYSTHEVNTLFPDLPRRFYWQKSFAVLTFGAKTIPYVTNYIQRQKEHHANHTTEAYLEYVG